MKEPHEIKEGLRKCLSVVNCMNSCPYAELGLHKCNEELQKDSLEYIDNLEERVAIMTDRPIAHWIDGAGNLVPFEKGGTVYCPHSGAVCSNCGEMIAGSDEDEVKGRFCPNCGAEMIEKE